MAAACRQQPPACAPPLLLLALLLLLARPAVAPNHCVDEDAGWEPYKERYARVRALIAGR